MCLFVNFRIPARIVRLKSEVLSWWEILASGTVKGVVELGERRWTDGQSRCCSMVNVPCARGKCVSLVDWTEDEIGS